MPESAQEALHRLLQNHKTPGSLYCCHEKHSYLCQDLLAWHQRHQPPRLSRKQIKRIFNEVEEKMKIERDLATQLDDLSQAVDQASYTLPENHDLADALLILIEIVRDVARRTPADA